MKFVIGKPVIDKINRSMVKYSFIIYNIIILVLCIGNVK